MRLLHYAASVEELPKVGEYVAWVEMVASITNQKLPWDSWLARRMVANFDARFFEGSVSGNFGLGGRVTVREPQILLRLIERYRAKEALRMFRGGV